jgi:two-component system, OmpR family, response regulator MtrA
MMPEVAAKLKVGALEVDPTGYRVWFEGQAVRLGRTEVELLAFLLANGHQVSSREQLSERVGLARGRSVDVVLSRLRRRLGRNFLRNVPSRGWIIDPDALEA